MGTTLETAWRAAPERCTFQRCRGANVFG